MENEKITILPDIKVQVVKTHNFKLIEQSISTENEQWINCVVLTRYPLRNKMLQEAISGFIAQDHQNKILTIVNDGSELCNFTTNFEGYGVILNINKTCSIGFKRNLAAKLVTKSNFIASMDDDDISLPNRLSTQLKLLGKNGVYHNSRMVFVAIDSISNIIGQKFGLYYGTSIVRTDVALKIEWPDTNWCEDHQFFQKIQNNTEYAKRIVQSVDMYYVVRRHSEDRASSKYAKNSEKEKLDIDFTSPESEKAQQIVQEILQQYRKEYIATL